MWCTSLAISTLLGQHGHLVSEGNFNCSVNKNLLEIIPENAVLLSSFFKHTSRCYSSDTSGIHIVHSTHAPLAKRCVNGTGMKEDDKKAEG